MAPPIEKKQVRRKLQSARGYASALAAVAAACALTMALGPWIKDNQSAFFILGVMVSSWYGGLGPGLLATAVSTLAVNYFFEEPLFYLNLHSDDLPRLMIFVVIAITINAFNETRKRIQGRLQQSENLFRSLVQGVHDYAIYMLDPQGHVVTWSTAAAQIQGYSTTQIVGESFACFFTREDQQDGKPQRVLRQATDQGRFQEETWWSRLDGSRYWASVAITALHDEEGKLVGFSQIVRDLTEVRRMEAQLQDRQSSLAHLARLGTLSELATGLAHELTQPLSAITLYSEGCLEMLRNAPGAAPDLLDAMEATATQAARASQIITHYRNFARRRNEQRGPTQLPVVIRSALQLVDYEIRRHAIHVEVAMPVDLPAVWGDGVQLEQVMVNVLKNAVEALADTVDQPRTLTVTAWRQALGRVCVEVRDNGPGLSQEVLARIIEPFYSTKDRGLGIGLPISRSIIEAHGGHLTVDGVAGGGAQVCITLPVEEGRGPSGAGQSAAMGSPQQGSS